MMKFKNNKFLIIIGIILLFFVIFSLSFFMISNLKKQNDDLYSKCYDLEKGFGGPIDTEMIDCKGYLRLEKSKLCEVDGKTQTCENTYVYDALNHTNFIKNAEKYLIKNNSLYVIGDLWPMYFSKDKNNQYLVNIPTKGNYTTEHYQSLPRYFVVNTETGGMILYNTYDQMPEEVKTIFKELE